MNPMIRNPHPCSGPPLVVALLWVWVLRSTSKTRGTVLAQVPLPLRRGVLDQPTCQHMNLKAIGFGLRHIELTIS